MEAKDRSDIRPPAECIHFGAGERAGRLDELGCEHSECRPTEHRAEGSASDEADAARGGSAADDEPARRIGRRVVYLVRSFPRFSQTFILNELLALEALGIEITVIALVKADDPLTQEGLDRLRARVVFLDDHPKSPIGTTVEHVRTLARRPGRYAGAAWHLMRQPEATTGYHGVTRWQAFDLGVRAVRALDLGTRRAPAPIHAHFAHDPALVAQVIADLVSVPFSFTGHARDLVQISPRALASRVASARAVITCCTVNAELLRSVSDGEHGRKVVVIPHGVDVVAFAPAIDPSRRRRGSVAAVGRLIEKKGFDVLIDAVADVVHSGVEVHLTIYGDGPLRSELAARVARARLDDHVTLAGECTQAELQDLLPQFTFFALTPYVAGDGDRDGLPTVLIEAMACGLPVVTTQVAGIPDLVTDGVNGIVCPPQQVAPVARALSAMLTDEPTRNRMAAAARATVVADFNRDVTSRRIADLLLAPSSDGPQRPRRRIARRDHRRGPECAVPPV